MRYRKSSLGGWAGRLAGRMSVLAAAASVAVLSASAETGGASTEEGFRNNMFLISSLQAILLILLLLWYLILSRRRELDATVRLPFRTFCEAHDGVLARHEALTRRHRELAGSGPDPQPISGKTLQCMQSVDALLAGVSSTWLEVMEVRGEIETQLRSHGIMSTETIARMRSQLGAQTSLEQANRDLSACDETLSRLEHGAEEAASLVESVGALRDTVTRNLASISAAGLSTAAYAQAAADLDTALDRAKHDLVGDPLGAEERLQEIQNRAAHLADWTAKALYHQRGLDEAWSLMHGVANETIAHRRGGCLLSEDGANPDPLLRQARAEHEAARLALGRGETDYAERYLEQCFSWCEQARQGMARHVAARTFCEETAPLLHRRAERYVADMQAAEARRQQLEASFAAESWADVAEALEGARGVFEACRPLMVGVEEAVAADRQHYFHAEDLLVHVEQQLALGETLLDALAARDAHLHKTRDTVLRGAEEVEQARERVANAIREAPHALSECTLNLFREQEKEWATTRAALSEPRPNWPQLERQSRAALAVFRGLLQQVVDEARAHDEGLLLLKRLRETDAEVGARLQQHHEQHDRAQKLHEETRQALGQIEKEVAAPRIDWLDAVSRLTDLHDRFQRAARWAFDDESLTRQAVREIREAEEDVHAAQGYYRLGVSADSSAAEAHLRQARHAMVSRNAGDALEHAAAASDDARRALQAALRAARQQQALTQRGIVRFDFEAADDLSRERAESEEVSFEPIASRPIEERPTFPSRTWTSASSTARTEWIASTRSAPSSE